MMKDQLIVNRLCKQIQNKAILKDISFSASTGDIIVVSGHNGAGKTTLLRIIAGLMPKSSGEVLWNRQSYGLDHGQIGYMSHKPMLYEALSVVDNLEFFARLYGCWSADKGRELLKLTGLWLHRYEPVGVLSRGMQQRLALARVLIGAPRLLLYDEPFTGLDLEGQRLLREIIQEYQSAALQIIVTHEHSFLEGLVYREIKLMNGKMEEGALR